MTGECAEGGKADWMACFCCGNAYPPDHLVRFKRHPEQGVCIKCAAWLNDRSRIVARQMYVPFRWWKRGRHPQAS
jgi:hypothetical protein